MKLIIRDSIIVVIIFFIWLFSLIFFSINKNQSFLESIKVFPCHLLITIGYYAILNVCYSILFISDCVSEHKELLDELEDGKNFFKKQGIKYN